MVTCGRARPAFADGFKSVQVREDVSGRVGVAGVEGEHGVADDVLVLAAEALLDERGELLDVEVEDAREQAEDEDVLALVLRGAADGLDGRAGHRHADVAKRLVVGVRLDVVGVVKEHAAGPEGADVRFVAVLIEGHEHVGAVAGGEDVAGAHAHLEDRRPARDGGRDRHVGHDVLVAAAGEAGEETADGLDAVLRIAGEADDDVVDALGTRVSAFGRGGGGIFSGELGVGFTQRVGWPLK